MTPLGEAQLVTSAETDATNLLKSVWQLEDAPVIPVDPVRIAVLLGLDVRTAPMEPGVSGALANRPGADTVIYLNQEEHSNRQRFTCAHELGHYYRRAATGETEYEFVDRRDALAGTGTNEEEIYANRFAAALLMPEEVVRDFHGKGMRAVGLALRFGVSVDAMTLRLRTLQLDA